jgi:hypothetical protein
VGQRQSKRHGDTGEADPAVVGALDAYACGTGSEHAALTAVAGARLLVPVVAVAEEANTYGTEKETHMALPTLVGNDGRTAIIAFTGAESMKRWREDARPVPATAHRVWRAAVAEGSAVVIDVAGPAQLVVEGARLAALAAGEQPPPPHLDPDVRAEIAAVTGDFTLSPGENADLTVILETTGVEAARKAAEEIAVRLGGRLRRGIEVRTF